MQLDAEGNLKKQDVTYVFAYKLDDIKGFNESWPREGESDHKAPPDTGHVSSNDGGPDISGGASHVLYHVRFVCHLQA